MPEEKPSKSPKPTKDQIAYAEWLKASDYVLLPPEKEDDPMRGVLRSRVDVDQGAGGDRGARARAGQAQLDLAEKILAGDGSATGWPGWTALAFVEARLRRTAEQKAATTKATGAPEATPEK